MSTLETTIEMDALLAHSAWLRRLAAALVNDPDEAQDLVQETWLVALRTRLRSPAAARAWLRRALVSRVRDARRAELRRIAREQATAGEAASAEDPEILAGRMQLHRLVASHMAALEEPIRQVLFLRFVEGLEPVDVARRLGIPGGTARWRLKRGVDELKARLDADFGGERERWVPLLLPLLPPRPSLSSPGDRAAPESRHGPEPLPRWSGAAAKLALGGLVLAVGAFGASRACTDAGPRGPAAAASALDGRPDLGAAAPPAARRVEPPPFASAPATAPALPRRCPEAEALEKERDALSAAIEPFRNPQVLFEQSPRNLEAEARLKPMVDEAFTAGGGHCGHAFECRGLACRVEVVVPPSNGKGTAGAPCVEIAPKIQFSDRVTFTRTGEQGSVFDPVSRTWLRRETYYLRLAAPSGEPVPRERRRPPALPTGWNRERGPLPAGLAPECKARASRVHREIEVLVRQAERDLPPRTVFASGSANAELSREAAEWLRPCLAPNGRDLPVDVECRGNTCALSPRSGEADSATPWKCPPDAVPRGMCFGDYEGDGWFARLVRCRALRSFMEVVEGPRRLPGGDEIASALVRARPPEARGGVPGRLVLMRLARERDFPSMVKECERLHPARGVLLIRARVPDTCGALDDSGPSEIGLELGGELFGSKLAACLEEKTRSALKAAELPTCVYGWRGEFRLEFPHPVVELDEVEEKR